jgi:phosphocarrier protein HPr
MISRDYIILAVEGIHARPATALLRLTRKFSSDIKIKKGDKLVPMKSMLNIMAISAKCGESITVLIDGGDEVEASMALETFFTEEMKNL